MNLPNIYPIVNISPQNLQWDYLGRLIEAGVSLLQLRAKDLHPEKMRPHIELCKQHQITCIVNDHIEMAQFADGIHLGQDDVKVELARERLGPNHIIGFSTHSLEQLQSAPAEANYLAVGPIFESPTKQGHAEVLGVEMLREAVTAVNRPLVAIGGITSLNAYSVYRRGVSCVAVISDIELAEDLPSKLKAYSEAASGTPKSSGGLVN